MSKNKETIKVIGITKNDCITGLEYGLIEQEVFAEGEIPKHNKTPTKKLKSTYTHKQVNDPIRQPALKWANKLSAAKKRILDATKKKQR